MKVDASFIGHDVTLASTLEAVSKNYGVKILFTGEFWSYLTDETRALTRRIDWVKFQNSPVDKVYDLYTIDLNVESIEVDIPDPKTLQKVSSQEIKRRRV
jgi:hypothetical protein